MDKPRKPSPKPKTPMVSGTFSVNDKKLRDHPRGFEYIENRLLQNKHHEVSLNDLAWYVTTSKPHFGRMKTQLSQDCRKILAAAAQEYKNVCKNAWEDATVELAKIANAECNKLNNTSSKIFKEMGKAEVVQAQLRSLHDMCADLVKEMSGARTSLFITRTELNHDMEKQKQYIDQEIQMVNQRGTTMRSAIDLLVKKAGAPSGTTATVKDATQDLNTGQIEQLKQICRTQNEMIKNQAMKIEGIQNDMITLKRKMRHLEEGTDGGNMDTTLRGDVDTLKQDVQGIKECLTNLLTSQNKDADDLLRSTYFPNVDPTKLKRPSIPVKKPNLDFNQHVKHDQLPSYSTGPILVLTPRGGKPTTCTDIIPYGPRVSVRMSGQTVECWIQKCYLLHDGVVEYEGSTSSGENIRFQAQDVFLHNITATPRKAPDNYIHNHTQHVHDGPMTYHHNAYDADMLGRHQQNTGGSHCYNEGGQQNPGGLYRHHGGPFHNDDNSYNSEQADSNDGYANSAFHTPRMRQPMDQSQRHSHQYAQNAFVYPKGTLPQYIREDKASSRGKAFTAHLGSNEDPRTRSHPT